MVLADLSKSITQPVAGVALLALMAVTSPVPAQARLQTATRIAQVGAVNNAVLSDVDYTLGGGDRIKINVFDVPEYSGEYQVPPGGRLYLPLIGSVTVNGLTQEQAADLISAKYSRFLKRPLVTVILEASRPVNVVVSGEVNRPGSYSVGLVGGAGTNPGVQYPTVVGAITLAQGVTLAADYRRVQLRRQVGLGPEQVITIDLTQLVQTGNQSQDVTLRDGDRIFVPTSSRINLGELREFSTASFAADPTKPRTVTVVGEVNRPGPYVVIGGATSGNTQLSQGGTITQGGAGNTTGLPTVTRAIQLAGGITEAADIRNIQVRRPTRIGTEQVININLWQLLQTGDVNQDTLVQDGDSIVVPTATELTRAEQTQLAGANFSPDTIQINVVGEVKTPGIVRVPLNSPLNQAIFNAGGFNNSRARKQDVGLIRLNPDGTVSKRTIQVDLTAGINDKTNPALRNNDIVIVARSGLARTGDSIGAVSQPVSGLLSILGILSVFGLF